jgi:hypothetical protein
LKPYLTITIKRIKQVKICLLGTEKNSIHNLVLNILQWYHNKKYAISFDGFAVLFFANKKPKDS